MKDRIRKGIQESVDLKKQLLADEALLSRVERAVEICVAAFRADGKALFCGNGGSAADAQHLAGELSGRFYLDREPLFAEALHVNTTFLTAVANDYSYDEVFARMVRAGGRAGDVLFALSTSGNSTNVVRAARQAGERGMSVIAFTGAGGGLLAETADVLIAIPSKDTPRIQECHILLGHLICELIEDRLFGKKES